MRVCSQMKPRLVYPFLTHHPNRVQLAISVSLLFIGNARPTEASWVDPDTPKIFHREGAYSPGDNREFNLVFSDEFELEGRTFGDGDDPRWTALEKNDYTNDALHFYKSENVRTTNGVLNISTTLEATKYKAFDEDTKKFYLDKKTVQTGMMQGWNKFCFIGGIVEFSAKLPGDPQIGGLWPALWMLGNLARGTYVGSSDYVWPFSYNKCADDNRVSQEINACAKVGHFGMDPGRGRGAPEIDILEAMGGEPGPLPNTHVQRPYFSASLQVAPGVKHDRPTSGNLPKKGHWYKGLEYGNVTKADINPFFYGVTLVHDPKSYTYQSDALSANMGINASHYSKMHKYRIEWEPPGSDGNGGYIRWFCDGFLVSSIKAESLSLTGTEIPSEPMSLLMNTAVASSWGFPTPCPAGCDCKCFDCNDDDCTCGLPTDYCKNFPAYFEIDYVRVWQAVNESKHVLGCSTDERPTDLFIKGHSKRYMEEDDKQPLKIVKKGGGSCHDDDDCGGQNNGKCYKGHCSCSDQFTGPVCMAHHGFYDHPFIRPELSIEMSALQFSNGLLYMSIALAVSFFIAVIILMYRHKKRVKYQEINFVNPHRLSQLRGMQQNKQLGSAEPYQYRDQQSEPKVLTYCMIDGQLIDEPR